MYVLVMNSLLFYPKDFNCSDILHFNYKKEYERMVLIKIKNWDISFGVKFGFVDLNLCTRGVSLLYIFTSFSGAFLSFSLLVNLVEWLFGVRLWKWWQSFLPVGCKGGGTMGENSNFESVHNIRLNKMTCIFWFIFIFTWWLLSGCSL